MKNESKRQKFKATLEQLYTTIKYDAEAFNQHSKDFDTNVKQIDSILNFPDSVSEKGLPYLLYYISVNGTPYTSESVYYSKELTYNPENENQKEITKEIFQYINAINTYKYQEEERLVSSLQAINIPEPKVNFNNGKKGWDTTDSTYYSKEDYKNLSELIRSKSFRALLKADRSYKIYNFYESANMNSDRLSIRELIKAYYTGVKVTY